MIADCSSSTSWPLRICPVETFGPRHRPHLGDALRCHGVILHGACVGCVHAMAQASPESCKPTSCLTSFWDPFAAASRWWPTQASSMESQSLWHIEALPQSSKKSKTSNCFAGGGFELRDDDDDDFRRPLALPPPSSDGVFRFSTLVPAGL